MTALILQSVCMSLPRARPSVHMLLNSPVTARAAVAYFDDDAIVELTGLIAFQNMSSKFNSALGVPAQGFCEIPHAEMSGPSRG